MPISAPRPPSVTRCRIENLLDVVQSGAILENHLSIRTACVVSCLLALPSTGCDPEILENIDREENHVPFDYTYRELTEDEMRMFYACGSLTEDELQKIGDELRAFDIDDAEGRDELAKTRLRESRYYDEWKPGCEALAADIAHDNGKEEAVAYSSSADSLPFRAGTRQEVELCASSFGSCVTTFELSRKATSTSKVMFPDGARAGRQDAFRHAFWNSLMVYELGFT